MIGTILVAAAAASEPMWTIGDGLSAASAPAQTLLLSGAVAGGEAWGAEAAARWWPTERVLLSAGAAAGGAWLPCPSCGGLGLTAGVRLNAVEQPWLRVGVYGLAEGLLAEGRSGQVSGGLSAEAGGEVLRLDVTMPAVSTVDLLTVMLSQPEAGLTVRYAERHTTRLSVLGIHFWPALSQRYTAERWWLGADLALPTGAAALKVQAGLRW